MSPPRPSSAERQQEPPRPAVARAHLFIVGSARTGSTLLRHVLNRAPEVCLASETHYMAWARRVGLERLLREVRDGGRRADKLATLAAYFYRPEAWIWLRRNVDQDEFARGLAATDLSLRSAFELLMELYAQRRCGIAPGEGIIGEKTPDHLRHVPTLVEWFPDARIIHTFRDPRAIYASQLRRTREGRWGLKARLPRLPSLLADPLLAPMEAVHTARAWRDAARLHEDYGGSLGARYRLVRFEDLVARPELEIRSICEFAGITYRPELVEGIDVVGSSFHAVRHSSSGFDSTTVGRWRDELHPLARSWFSMVLRGRLDAFGYDR